MLFLSTLPVRGATAVRQRRRPSKIFPTPAPGGGSDTDATACKVTEVLFLSTLPVRGATRGRQCHQCHTEFLSTLPVRGATFPFLDPFAGQYGFLSTLPVRGATIDGRGVCVVSLISIHAPREGSDGVDFLCLFRGSCISIHAPREGSDARLVLLPYSPQ